MTERIDAPSDDHESRILRERARALARPPAQEAASSASIDVLLFRLASERYAIASEAVSEVYTLDDLTPLPCTPAHVCGVLNLRGRILVVLDVKQLLGLSESGLVDLHQVVVVTLHGMTVGLLADVIDGVVRLETATLRPVPDEVGRIGCFRGVDPHGTLVLDIDRLLGDPSLVVDDDME